jgi:hypothetical protein
MHFSSIFYSICRICFITIRSYCNSNSRILRHLVRFEPPFRCFRLRRGDAAVPIEPSNATAIRGVMPPVTYDGDRRRRN